MGTFSFSGVTPRLEPVEQEARENDEGLGSPPTKFSNYRL